MNLLLWGGATAPASPLVPPLPAYIVVCSQIYTTSLTDLEQVKNRSTEVMYTHAETASQWSRAAHTAHDQ
jgi:hypothetical protein